MKKKKTTNKIDLHQTNQEQSRSVVYLLLCLCVPVMFTWFQTFMKILFGGKKWPSFKIFFAVSKILYFMLEMGAMIALLIKRMVVYADVSSPNVGCLTRAL